MNILDTVSSMLNAEDPTYCWQVKYVHDFEKKASEEQLALCRHLLTAPDISARESEEIAMAIDYGTFLSTLYRTLIASAEIQKLSDLVMERLWDISRIRNAEEECRGDGDEMPWYASSSY